METVLVFIMLCGQLDTIILKVPNEPQVQTNHITLKVEKAVVEILNAENKPIVIMYDNKVAVCI